MTRASRTYFDSEGDSVLRLGSENVSLRRQDIIKVAALDTQEGFGSLRLEVGYVAQLLEVDASLSVVPLRRARIRRRRALGCVFQIRFPAVVR